MKLPLFRALMTAGSIGDSSRTQQRNVVAHANEHWSPGANPSTVAGH